MLPQIMKKTVDDVRTKLVKSEAAVQKLEKDNKELKEEIAQLHKDKKALESVAGDTASLKEQVTNLSEQVYNLASYQTLHCIIWDVHTIRNA